MKKLIIACILFVSYSASAEVLCSVIHDGLQGAIPLTLKNDSDSLQHKFSLNSAQTENGNHSAYTINVDKTSNNINIVVADQIVILALQASFDSDGSFQFERLEEDQSIMILQCQTW